MRGHQKNVRKEEGSQSQNTEQVERIPRSRPRIYNEGTNGRPIDIDYFKIYNSNVTRPKRDDLHLTQLKYFPEAWMIERNIILYIMTI